MPTSFSRKLLPAFFESASFSTNSGSANDPEWDLEILSIAGEYIDYISNHQYLGSDEYYETVAGAHWVEKRLQSLSSVIDIFNTKKQKPLDIKIAMDEWNIWYRGKPENNWEYIGHQFITSSIFLLITVVIL